MVFLMERRERRLSPWAEIMYRIIMLNEDLESQMRMYLALCPRYRVEIAENEIALMRLIRRKRPQLLLLDAHHSRLSQSGKSAGKLIEKIKHKHNRLRILAIVRSEQARSHGAQMQQHGADDWVDHLIDGEVLAQRIDQLVVSAPPITVTFQNADFEAHA
jgi:DNA-binding response OmpR family regulator